MPIVNAVGLEPPQPLTSTERTQPTATTRALARIAHDPDALVADRDRLRARSHRDGVDDPSGRRVDSGDAVVDRPGHPDAVRAHGDTTGAAPDRNAPHDPIRVRVDLHEPVAEPVGDPHGPLTDGELGGWEVEADRRDDPVQARVDPPQRAVVRIADHPDGA